MTTQVGWPESEPITIRIVDAIASELNVDRTQVSPPLYHTIDPDALETVLDSTDSVSVTFDYEGRSVTVRSDGSVTVDGTSYDGAITDSDSHRC